MGRVHYPQGRGGSPTYIQYAARAQWKYHRARAAFCFLSWSGVECSVGACWLFASGEGEKATDGIEVARSAGHTEVALQSIVGETGILIALGGVYVGTALGEMQGCFFAPSLLGERL
mgnify:CR=1 FL=1